MKIRSVILFFLVTVACATPGHAQTVYLSVAASMTEVFNEIIDSYSQTYPDAKILPNYASSGSLAKQIDQGAPAHIFVSANPKWMQFLIEKKMIAQGSDRVFAYNKLVFAAPATTSIKTLAEVKTLSLIGIGSPESVPAGQYAKQAMEKIGIYAELKADKKFILAKSVREALLYADRGEVDGSFVYRTDALLAKNAKILFTVPDELYDRVVYPSALTSTGATSQTAKSFYDFMTSPTALTILEKYGFEPASK